MNKKEVCVIVERIGLLPSVRVPTAELAVFAAEAVYEAGIPVVEITTTVPNAVDVIAQLARNYPDFVVGAGTVLDTETASRSLDAGARFITSPGLIKEVVDYTLESDTVAIPGALTPSEVIAAWKGGADFVKIFPCSQLGGRSVHSKIKGPLAANSPDRVGGRQSGDGSEFHLCWRLLPGSWVRTDAEESIGGAERPVDS
jgi:2-dehydro-3-deoxyphosphogluconate aldolase/(4S)-4-hydroxy-2-oxoglutarate aldolase